MYKQFQLMPRKITKAVIDYIPSVNPILYAQ